MTVLFAETVLASLGMQNGKISPTVASNNLAVAIKTLAGSNPSATDPVYVVINGSVRAITSSLSLTVNAGTNTFNAGASELKTLEVDYFVYLCWKAASSAVVLLISRVPYGSLYSDFSGTAEDEKYAAYSSAPASTDDVVLVGRFAATNSGAASYNWSVPTYTSSNLKHHPVNETRWLTWRPTLTGYSANPTGVYTYKVVNTMVFAMFTESADGTSNATTKSYSFPISSNNSLGFLDIPIGAVKNNGTIEAGGIARVSGTGSVFRMFRSALGAWTDTGSARIYSLEVFYRIKA